MVTKQTKKRIILSIWEAVMLWGTGLYIGGVVIYYGKYCDNEVSFLSVVVASSFIFPFLIVLLYVNNILKEKYGDLR